MAIVDQTVEVQELRDTFEVDGVTYLAYPTLEEFIVESGITSKSTITRNMRAFEREEIDNVSTLLSMTLNELADIEGISVPNAKILFKHASLVKTQGKLVVDYNRKVKQEKTFSYLPTGSTSLDEMMTHSGREVGYRSKTLIEIYGQPASGKTQICYTAAAMILRPKNIGGWGRGIAYIDSEGSFVLNRFKNICKYWGVEKETLRERFLYSRVSSFDEVDQALNDITKRIKEMDIGMIIVDSIMSPLKSQYPIGGCDLINIIPRQKHLKRVADKLKSYANIYNLIVIYTNHVIHDINTNRFDPKKYSEERSVLGHIADIQIYLDRPNFSDLAKFKIDRVQRRNLGIKMTRAKIMNCGYLPEAEGYFMIGPMGIADPNRWEEVVAHCEKIVKDGYISIDSHGNVIRDLDVGIIHPEVILERNRNLLYGRKKEKMIKKRKQTTKNNS